MIGTLTPRTASVEGFSVGNVAIEKDEYDTVTLTGSLYHTHKGSSALYAMFEISPTEDDFTFEFYEPSGRNVPNGYVPDEYKEIDPKYYIPTHSDYICYTVIKPMIDSILQNAVSNKLLTKGQHHNETIKESIQDEIEEAEEYLLDYKEELRKAIENKDEDKKYMARADIKEWSTNLVELRQKEVCLYFTHFVYLLHTLSEMEEAYNVCKRLYPTETFVMVAILAKQHIFGLESENYAFENVRAFTTRLTDWDSIENNLPKLIQLAKSRYGQISGYFVYNAEFDFSMDKDTFIELLKP